MVLPLDTLANARPINPVTPFTYRDNDTNLTMVRGLRKKVDELIEYVNNEFALNETDHTNIRADFQKALDALRVEILAVIDALETDATAFNPTTGTRTDGVSKVIGDVYDNTRVFAYFAKQYDDLDLTAAEYDALNYSARHFDLGVTYPTINDVQGV
jgi:hypothetical protein